MVNNHEPTQVGIEPKFSAIWLYRMGLFYPDMWEQAQAVNKPFPALFSLTETSEK